MFLGVLFTSFDKYIGCKLCLRYLHDLLPVAISFLSHLPS